MIKIFFILNRKVTPQKNRCVGCWLLALPRAQMTRLSRILGVWFTYYVPVLINFMTPSKHLSIAYQGINLRRLLRFFFLSKAPHGQRNANQRRRKALDETAKISKITTKKDRRYILPCFSSLQSKFTRRTSLIERCIPAMLLRGCVIQ